MFILLLCILLVPQEVVLPQLKEHGSTGNHSGSGVEIFEHLIPSLHKLEQSLNRPQTSPFCNSCRGA